MRKILIGFVSLGVVLGLYLLYIRTSKTPEIDTDRVAQAIKSVTDGTAIDPDSEMGKVGDVGIGPVETAHYVTRNPKTQEIVQETGFEKLLHADQDVWEIEKPYMNVYRQNFKCFLTADKGQVKVETAVGRTTLRDARFSSNVVIHIVPTGLTSFKESFVYLDDVIFLSEKSLLTTAGPIRFESKDARMSGKGLELIYNEQAERLEYFTIIDLENMSYRITDSQAAVFSSTQTPAESGTQAEAHEPNEITVAKATDEKKILPMEAPPPTKQQEGEYYTFVLNDNVLIDTPEQLIFADERLQIDDIFGSKAFIDQADKVKSEGTDQTNTGSPAMEQDAQSKQGTIEPNAPLSEPFDPNETPDKKATFVVITCDGGLTITPRDSIRIPDKPTEVDLQTTTSGDGRPEQLDDGTERTKFFARTIKINFNNMIGNMTASGWSEPIYYKAETITTDVNEPPDVLAEGPIYLEFYTDPNISGDDANLPATENKLIPVSIKAHSGAYYYASLNQIAFEGDCQCTMLREDPNVIEEYVLHSERITIDLTEDVNDRRSEPAKGIENLIPTSERMTVDLAGDINDRTSGLAAGIEHLTATGEVVRLATTKKAKAGGAFTEFLADPNETGLLGGIELKCKQFDYDAAQQLYWATGPGIIKLNNRYSKNDEQETNNQNQDSRFSLKHPCWAVVSGFKRLEYSLLKNRILAKAFPQDRLGIVYLPITDSADSGDVMVTASEVEVFLLETDEGEMELATLKATGGLLYEDDKNHQFIGNELSYDHTTAIVKIKGDEVQPCYHNGIPVDQIKYDLNTDKVEFNVVGPSSILDARF